MFVAVPWTAVRKCSAYVFAQHNFGTVITFPPLRHMLFHSGELCMLVPPFQHWFMCILIRSRYYHRSFHSSQTSSHRTAWNRTVYGYLPRALSPLLRQLNKRYIAILRLFKRSCKPYLWKRSVNKCPLLPFNILPTEVKKIRFLCLLSKASLITAHPFSFFFCGCDTILLPRNQRCDHCQSSIVKWFLLKGTERFQRWSREMKPRLAFFLLYWVEKVSVCSEGFIAVPLAQRFLFHYHKCCQRLLRFVESSHLLLETYKTRSVSLCLDLGTEQTLLSNPLWNSIR